MRVCTHTVTHSHIPTHTQTYTYTHTPTHTCTLPMHRTERCQHECPDSGADGPFFFLATIGLLDL